MKLREYLKSLKVTETNLSVFDTEITGVTSRSSEVKPGNAFVCIKGLRQNGHLFTGEAVKNGAALIVAQNGAEIKGCPGIPYVKVENTREALSLMCAVHYGNPETKLRITGVTGTNGKTSTCAILSGIYREEGMKVLTLGTLGGGLTTPDPEELFPMFKKAVDERADRVVMEASSHALALGKLRGIRFENALFTNLTAEHLDFHSDMREYALAKALLFQNADNCFFNIDDPMFELVSSLSAGRVITYSTKNKSADYFAENVVLRGTDGISYDLSAPDGRISVSSRLCGIFSVYNTLGAASIAFADGVPGDTVKKALEKVGTVPGRLEKIPTKSGQPDIYIDYAHTPDALEKTLLCVRGFKRPGQRITLLFGCGGDRDRSKRKVMGKTASTYADFVIVTSDNSRSENPSDIIKEIMKGIDKERPHTVIEDRRRAITYAVMNASEDDIILLAGKGHENYEINSLGKRYFSEKEIVEEALKKRFGEK